MKEMRKLRLYVVDCYEYLLNTQIQATERLSKKELQEYKDIFSFFDRDGGGSITSVELGQVGRS
jgi:Ca2+-binding EF-hand superfamily protein